MRFHSKHRISVLHFEKVAKGSKDGESIVALVKLTKAEKNLDRKKSRKEVKQAKNEVLRTPRTQVLDEVKKDLTAEDTLGRRKNMSLRSWVVLYLLIQSPILSI